VRRGKPRPPGPRCVSGGSRGVHVYCGTLPHCWGCRQVFGESIHTIIRIISLPQ